MSDDEVELEAAPPIEVESPAGLMAQFDSQIEPEIESQPEAPVEPEVEEEKWAFPEDQKQEFEGLLFVGSLKDSFTWLGHKFVMKTMTTNETLQVALAHKPYVGTLGEIKAYQAAVVAGSVVSVDGHPLPQPLSASDMDLQSKFDYVLEWYPAVLDYLYDRYRALEATVVEVLNSMGESSG